MSFKCDKVRLSKEILYLFYQKKNKAARRLFFKKNYNFTVDMHG